MQDAFAESTARLEQLARKVMKERDPVKYHQLAAFAACLRNEKRANYPAEIEAAQ